MKLRKIFLISVFSLLILLLIPAVSACSSGGGAVKTLKIGACEPLTGPPSIVGTIYVHGFQMAIDEVNDRGGLKINGDTYMVELIAEDNAGNPDGAATAATKLIHQDGVKFIFGDTADWDTPAVWKVASEAGDVMFIHAWLNSPASIGGTIDVGPDKPLMIRLHPAWAESLDKPTEYLAENYPDVKTCGISALDFADFDVFGPLCDTVFAKYGLKVAGDYERFAPDCIDFQPVITRMLASNPDSINVLHAGLDQFILHIKAAREMGFEGPLVHVPPYDVSLVSMLTSPDLNDVFGNGIATDDPNLPNSIKKVIEMGHAKYGSEFISDSTDAYDTMSLFLQLVEKAQSVDPQKVQDTFETLTKPGSLQSIFGPAHVGGLKTNGVNRVIVKPMPFSRVVNGKAEFLGCFTTDIP